MAGEQKRARRLRWLFVFNALPLILSLKKLFIQPTLLRSMAARQAGSMSLKHHRYACNGTQITTLHGRNSNAALSSLACEERYLLALLGSGLSRSRTSRILCRSSASTLLAGIMRNWLRH